MNYFVLLLLIILVVCAFMRSDEPFVSLNSHNHSHSHKGTTHSHNHIHSQTANQTANQTPNQNRNQNQNQRKRPNGSGYKVNLINECPVTVLSAALGPTPVKPSDGSWVLKPGQKIQIDIPKEWESTAGNPHVNGPRFWARTGCTYDIGADRASCEGGDCAGKYDCSAANKGGSPPGTWGEFCFNCGDGLTYYDVSLVDGSHMSMDIKPVNHSQSHPGNPGDPFWCKSNLCNKNKDLRDPKICPQQFQLLNTQLKNHHPNTPPSVTACFSNCGKWAYEKGLLGGNVTYDPQHPHPSKNIENICQNWRKYCCQSPSSGNPCKTDKDCLFGEACWNGTCQCRAYYRNLKCDPKICTHPYCECQGNQGSPVTPPILTTIKRRGAMGGSPPQNGGQTHTLQNKYNDKKPIQKLGTGRALKNCDNSACPQGFSTQPLPVKCSIAEGCVGDDVFHQVCTQAYTWPNDPQTYNCDAKEYNVTFCPGGTPIKMANSIGQIPNCQTLQKNPEYGYQKALQDCSISIQNNKTYSCARKTSEGPWSCGIDPNASCYNLGVLCQFNKTNSNEKR